MIFLFAAAFAAHPLDEAAIRSDAGVVTREVDGLKLDLGTISDRGMATDVFAVRGGSVVVLTIEIRLSDDGRITQSQLLSGAAALGVRRGASIGRPTTVRPLRAGRHRAQRAATKAPRAPKRRVVARALDATWVGPMDAIPPRVRPDGPSQVLLRANRMGIARHRLAVFVPDTASGSRVGNVQYHVPSGSISTGERP